MLYRTIHIGKDKYSCEVPQSWNEVSFNQLLLLMKASNDAEVFSALTGLSKELLQINELVDFYIWLDHNTTFRHKPFPANDTNPNLTWIYKDKVYTIPKDINYASIGQYEDMKHVVKDLIEGKDPIKLAEQYPMVVAIYLQKLIDGDYDYNKAVELSKELLEYPCEEISNTANFFLSKFLRLRGITPKCFQQGLTLQKLKRLVLTAYTKASAFMQHSSRSQVETLRK